MCFFSAYISLSLKVASGFSMTGGFRKLSTISPFFMIYFQNLPVACLVPLRPVRFLSSLLSWLCHLWFLPYIVCAFQQDLQCKSDGLQVNGLLCVTSDTMASKSQSVILSHFDIPQSQNGNFQAKCKHCSQLIKGSSKATSNFVTHLKVSVNMLNRYSMICLHITQMHYILLNVIMVPCSKSVYQINNINTTTHVLGQCQWVKHQSWLDYINTFVLPAFTI